MRILQIYAKNLVTCTVVPILLISSLYAEGDASLLWGEGGIKYSDVNVGHQSQQNVAKILNMGTGILSRKYILKFRPESVVINGTFASIILPTLEPDNADILAVIIWTINCFK